MFNSSSGKSLYCIGYGDYSLDDFISVLKNMNIKILVDIRSNPDPDGPDSFSQLVLREKLSTVDIIYHWAGRQFGENQTTGKGSLHTQLPAGLEGFAEHMRGPEFPRAVMQLTNLASKGKTALMCTEPRSMLSHCDLIADYLLLHGMDVTNIHSDDNMIEHTLSISARRESVELIYDRDVKN